MRKSLFIFLCAIISCLPAVHSYAEKTELAEIAEENEKKMHEFIHALARREGIPGQSYLDEAPTIPEIREHTRIIEISSLPSPKKDIRVVVAYFEGKPKRLAFIWEAAVKEKRIKTIRVVYDGSNQFMNEENAVKEYETTYKTTVMLPSKFPFNITHIEGNVEEQSLLLTYRNENAERVLHLTVTPKMRELDYFKRKNDSLYSLKDETAALYQPVDSTSSKILFQHDQLQYSVSIQHVKNKPNMISELIQIANSMVGH